MKSPILQILLSFFLEYLLFLSYVHLRKRQKSMRWKEKIAFLQKNKQRAFIIRRVVYSLKSHFLYRFTIVLLCKFVLVKPGGKVRRLIKRNYMQLHVTSMLHITWTKCYHWMNIDENWKWKVTAYPIYCIIYIYLSLQYVEQSSKTNSIVHANGCNETKKMKKT